MLTSLLILLLTYLISDTNSLPGNTLGLTSAERKAKSEHQKALDLWLLKEIGNNEVALVNLAISQGADVNAASLMHIPKAEVPLQYAIIMGNPEIVSLLLRKGANVNQKSFRGNTALISAVVTANKDTAIINLLVGSKDLHIDAKDSFGDTALIKAVEGSKLKIAEMLIKAGADIDRKGRLGTTPLMIAVEKSNANMVKMLLKYGANKNIVSEMDGLTVLENRNLSFEMIDILSSRH